jgi:N-acetylglucosamine kinase-like BadF-type ATPase
VDGALLVGVDGGKSKTVCLLARGEEGIVGAGRAGSSDKYDVPLEQALDAVAAAVRQAAEQAGVALPVDAACFGLAGADWEEDFAALKEGLEARGLARRLVVKNDMHIALHANASHGVVLSGGTHAAAAIRTPDGEEWHSAWYSVEGAGGVQAGHRALWAVLQAQDGRSAPTALTPLVLAATGASQPEELLRWLAAGRIDDAFLARLAPLLFDAYYEHLDPVASEIIMELGRELALWVTALLARFQLLDQDIPVVLSGGLFKGKGPLLRDTVTMMVHARAPRAVVQAARREPALGALIYAYELPGVPATPQLMTMLEKTLPDAGFFRTG